VRFPLEQPSSQWNGRHAVSTNVQARSRAPPPDDAVARRDGPVRCRLVRRLRDRPWGATGAGGLVRSWVVTAVVVALVALALVAGALLVGAVTAAVAGAALLVLWGMFRPIGPLE
jgi:hypothetical protein